MIRVRKNRAIRIGASTIAITCALALSPSSSAAQLPPPTEKDVDNIEGSFVQLATFPVRPFLIHDEVLWAINHHDSTVQRYNLGTATPLTPTYAVPWNPVAIAYWRNDVDEDSENHRDELLVSCRGTWAVVRLDMTTGEIVGLFQAGPLQSGTTRMGEMAEPGDIIVDQTNNRAFVSGSGGDSVAQIDLATGSVYLYNQSVDSDFRCKFPLFLSFAEDGERVLVAPLISGNNTVVHTGVTTGGFSGPIAPADEVVDLKALPTAQVTASLPDEDLFLIDPSTNDVTVALKETGTVLFMQRLSPTGELWQLNTEALNGKALPQTEPVFNGHFAQNRVTIVTNPLGTTPTKSIISLDPAIGGPITSAEAVGQPFALDFLDMTGHAGDGNAFIAGLGSNNVVVLDSSGTFVKEWDLPAISLPRGVLVDPTGDQVLVYCWGENKIRTYNWNVTPVTAGTVYDLGFDPAPRAVRGGRLIFFGSSRSEENNLSCATCHVEGGSDFLAWNLSNLPLDDKGPMMTQTMTGLERLGPFHWRGERQLHNFNGAFSGLLGASSDLDPTDLEDFQAFVFSLTNPANPFQNRTRVVDASIVHPNAAPSAADAVTAFGAYRGTPLFRSVSKTFTCESCHQLPTGTGNDIFNDAPVARPSRSNLKPAPFHELWRREQTPVDVRYQLSSSSTWFDPQVAFLGSAGSHGGNVPGVPEFISLMSSVGTTVNIRNGMANLIHQWDQGLAPAVHFAFRVDANTTGADVNSELRNYLVYQAHVLRNCDAAAIGRAKNPSSGTMELRRWFWDRSVLRFVCEDSAYANRTPGDFHTAAISNGESAVFLGLPVGMAERWAVDYDMDEILNMSETAGQETTYNAASSPTAPNVVYSDLRWWTGKVARLRVDTDRPSAIEVTYQDTASWSTPQVVSDNKLSRYHSILLTGLRPSTSTSTTAVVTEPTVQYTVSIVAKDGIGTAASPVSGQTLTTEMFIESSAGTFAPTTPDVVRIVEQHVVSKMTPSVTGTNPASVSVTVRTGYLRGQRTTSGEYSPADNLVVIGRVLISKWNSTTSSYDDIEEAPSGSVTATGNTGQFAALQLLLGTTVLNAPVPGQNSLPTNPEILAAVYLTGNGGAASGETTFDFDITGLSTLDRVYFDIDEVFRTTLSVSAFKSLVTTPASTLIVPVADNNDLDQWNFPDTTEANSAVFVTL